jgi:hypothetical protein
MTARWQIANFDFLQNPEGKTVAVFEGWTTRATREKILAKLNSYDALVAFVEAFDKWQTTGDGIADDEGGFSDVEAARNAVPIEGPTT